GFPGSYRGQRLVHTTSRDWSRRTHRDTRTSEWSGDNGWDGCSLLSSSAGSAPGSVRKSPANVSKYWCIQGSARRFVQFVELARHGWNCIHAEREQRLTHFDSGGWKHLLIWNCLRFSAVVSL